MKRHIILLIAGLLVLALALSGLKSLDSKISMPLLGGAAQPVTGDEIPVDPSQGGDTEQPGETTEEPNEMVRVTVAAIDSIGDVSLDNRQAVETARAKYDALADADKAQVTNLAALEAAEAQLAALEKEAAAQTPAQPEQTPAQPDNSAQNGGVKAGDVAVGDKVTFTGGKIYGTAYASGAAKTLGAQSACTVTICKEDAAHPYHLISDDGGGVYGWVDASSVEKG